MEFENRLETSIKNDDGVFDGALADILGSNILVSQVSAGRSDPDIEYSRRQSDLVQVDAILVEEYNFVAEILRYVQGSVFGEAAEKLRCSRRTIERYRAKLLEEGPNGLEDKRQGHNTKVGKTEEKRTVDCKLEGEHRSARFIRDKLGLLFHRDTVRRILVRHHLSRITLPPVKRVERFEAPHPNALWQIDIMGRTHFPLIGQLYLIRAIDDHGRFIPYGQWFCRQYGINVYQVMYKAFIRYGLPRGHPVRPGIPVQAYQTLGEANYQWYARQLGINPLYGRKPQAKGKIEGLFRFVQRDFVLENVHLTAIKEVNEAYLRWLDNYNFNHEHEGINKQCPAGSSRRPPLPIMAIITGFLMSTLNAESGQN